MYVESDHWNEDYIELPRVDATPQVTFRFQNRAALATGNAKKPDTRWQLDELHLASAHISDAWSVYGATYAHSVANHVSEIDLAVNRGIDSYTVPATEQVRATQTIGDGAGSDMPRAEGHCIAPLTHGQAKLTAIGGNQGMATRDT